MMPMGWRPQRWGCFMAGQARKAAQQAAIATGVTAVSGQGNMPGKEVEESFLYFFGKAI
jgi:hypothetical protein